MTAEDLEKRLENMILPDVRLADHYRELRASLVESHSSLAKEDAWNGMFGRLRSYLMQFKPRALVVSASLIIIIVLVAALQFTGVFSGISSVLNKVSAAMEGVESYRVEADAYNRSEYTNHELVGVYYYKGEFSSSKRYRMIQEGSIIDTEMIVIDNRVYIKGDTTTPLTPDQVTESLPSKRQTLDQLNTLVVSDDVEHARKMR